MSSAKRTVSKKCVNSSSSGNRGRCGIYDDIDSLADCAALPENKRFPTLIAQLQKILNQLAYGFITGEGAALETHEEWHGKFTDRLYEAAGQARADAMAHRATATTAPGGATTVASAADDRPLPAAPPQRKAPDDLPDSLRRIMNGSHESLNESDEDS